MMHWLWLILAILMPGGFIIYGVGMWLLGIKVSDVWRKEHTPVMYDGKEPFAQWQEKMERARRLQEREERDAE